MTMITAALLFFQPGISVLVVVAVGWMGAGLGSCIYNYII